MPKARRPRSVVSPSIVPQVVAQERGSVKSAARVLEIFEFFTDVQREARLGEISRRLDYPQSSASVLLKSLVTLGYLHFDPATKSYFPSPRLTLLGQWIAQGPFREGTLTRLMEELNRLTGHTICLGARNGLYSQYIHVIQGTTPLRFHLPPGTRRLLAWSSVGFCILSQVDPGDVEKLVRRTNAEAAPDQKQLSLAAVRTEIEGVRARGYVFSRGLVTPGAGMIAMPLPPSGELPAYPLALCAAGLARSARSREETDRRQDARGHQTIHELVGRESEWRADSGQSSARGTIVTIRKMYVRPWRILAHLGRWPTNRFGAHVKVSRRCSSDRFRPLSNFQKVRLPALWLR